jgi:RNA polymerase sigma factor (sigma-70 family)
MSTNPLLPDSEACWNRFRDGDRVAFEALVRGQYRRLFEYGTRFSRDRDFLKDCIQDLFLDLWEHRRTLGPTPSVKFYLFKALRHRIFKEKRHAERFVATDDSAWEAVEMADDLNAELVLVAQETAGFERKKLAHLLRGLTRRQQEIIHLKFYESLSHEEISELLELSRPAVCNLLSAALRQLRTAWWRPAYALLVWFLLGR